MPIKDYLEWQVIIGNSSEQNYMSQTKMHEKTGSDMFLTYRT